MLAFLLLISDESNHAKIEYLYNTFHDDMLRFAKYRLKKAGNANYNIDAEDVVQNAFVKITKYIDSINIDAVYAQIKSYVFSIVINETLNLIADNRFFENIDDNIEEISDNDFFNQLHIKEKYDNVVDAIIRMDEKYSTALLYYYVKEMSVKEIAELLGVSEKTVYTRLERGKRLLVAEIREVSYE